MLSRDAVAGYEHAMRTGAELRVRGRDGGAVTRVDLARWLAPADRTDLSVLRHCTGRVLDIGCGPGRMVAALTAAGVPSLGIDIAREAVRNTRDRGGQALRRDVYGPVPDEGGWGTALLLDGNVGIGGDPERLFARIHDLLAPHGRIVVETDPDRARSDRADLVVVDEDGRAISAPFSWARLGLDHLARTARRSAFRVTEVWSPAGRTFAVLTRTDRPGSRIAERSVRHRRDEFAPALAVAAR